MASGRSIRAGRAYVELSANNRPLMRGLKSAERSLKSFGASAMRIGGVATAVGATILGAFISPIKAASELEAAAGKFDVVFGKNSASVKSWAASLQSEIGRSKTEVLSFLSSSQDLLVPMGIDPATAEKTSKDLTKLAYDLASFNDMADGDAMRDLQSALTGSGEVMKKYGVVMDNAAVKQQLMNSGLDPKNATNAQKVMARMAIITAKTTAAQGDAVRTSGEFSNVLKRMTASVTNLSASVGSAVLPTLSKLGMWFSVVVSRVSEWVKINPGLIKGVAAAGAVAVVAGAAVSALGAAGFIAGAAVSGLASVAAALAAAVGLILSPLGAVAAIAAGSLTMALSFVTDGFTNIGGAVEAATDALSPFVDVVRGTIEDAVAAVSAGNLEAAWGIMTAALSLGWTVFSVEVGRVWSRLASGIASKMIDAKAAVLKVWLELSTSIKKIWAQLWSGLIRGQAMATGFVVDLMLEMQAFVTGGDAEAVKATRREDTQRRVAAAGRDMAGSMAAADADLEGGLRDIEADRSGAQDVLRETNVMAGEERLAAARERLQMAREFAQFTADQSGDAGTGGDGQAGVETLQKARRNAGKELETAGAQRGQLAGRAISRDTVAEKQLDALTQIATNTDPSKQKGSAAVAGN